jgi:tetratricopeptide (TPR) repeat protein
MKSLKTCLFMLLILTCLTLAIKAADEFDILGLIPAISGKSKCNFASLKQMFSNYAGNAAAQVAPADKILVTNYVSKYPEGGEPPTLIDNALGGYDTIIPSRAAAFYLAGVQAVIQQNRVVAFWCFSEAAWRNPQSPLFLNNAAFALIEFGYLADALKALQCANSLALDFVSPYINLGKVLALLGRCAEAAEHYNTGFLKFPTNPHYLWLAANAYKCAGKLPQGWGLGTMGKALFPGVYDWDSFLTSLNYTPPTQTYNCPDPGCMQPSACYNLSQKITQSAAEMSAARGNYMVNVEMPALDQADVKWWDCVQANGACVAYCQAQSPPILCCTTDCELIVAPCVSSSDSLKISTLSQARSFHLARLNEFLNTAMAEYQASLPNLTAEQADFILCIINSFNDTTYIINNYNSDIKKYQNDIQRQNSDVATAIKSCAYAKNDSDPVKYQYLPSNAGYIDWVTTGHVTTGLEPKYCLTAFCFGYDAISGDFSFEVSAGLAAKYTRNAFTGDSAVSLGVGLKLGVGLSSIGGNAWVKLSPKQVGVEAKLNAGPAKVGYFYGAEHL